MWSVVCHLSGSNIFKPHLPAWKAIGPAKYGLPRPGTTGSWHWCGVNPMFDHAWMKCKGIDEIALAIKRSWSSFMPFKLMPDWAGLAFIGWTILRTLWSLLWFAWVYIWSGWSLQMPICLRKQAAEEVIAFSIALVIASVKLFGNSPVLEIRTIILR